MSIGMNSFKISFFLFFFLLGYLQAKNTFLESKHSTQTTISRKLSSIENRSIKQNPKKFVVYYQESSISQKKYYPKDVPTDIIPEVAYSFFSISDNGTVAPGDPQAFKELLFNSTDNGVQPLDKEGDGEKYHGNLGQFKKLKAKNNFQLTAAIGGAVGSKSFSNAVKPENQQNFAVSVTTLLKTYDIFTGISFDWEFLSNNGENFGQKGNAVSVDDAKNFESFLKLLRGYLNANNLSKTQLSFIVTPNYNNIKFSPKALEPYLDDFSIMTYDFYDGNWGQTITAHQTNLNKVPYQNFSVVQAVDEYIKQGVPSQKIMIGAVTYSRGFSNSDGVGKSASGGSTDTTWATEVADYRSLPRQGAVEYYDPVAGAAFSYDQSKRLFNSYDNPQSIAAKCAYVKEKNLKGIIVWEASGDYRTDNPRSIIKALHDNLQ